MKPIGGYFELERGPYAPLHDGVLLNSGRSALRLIVRLLKISRIHVPNYTCPVVYDALKAEGCETIPYNLDVNLMPTTHFNKDDFILANDYFGLTGRNVEQLAAECPNLIVDNAQSYFAKPIGRAAFYSPRKFMGLPDGGIAVFNRDAVNIPELEVDQSYDRMVSLLKRHDLGPSAGYADFKATSRVLSEMPVQAMSNLTRALISSIDSSEVRSRRLANFAYLHNQVKSIFPINMVPESAPLVYPFVSRDPDLRKKLIDAQIFVATYWPGCTGCDEFVSSIIAIPIDQRYDQMDMARIAEVLT